MNLYQDSSSRPKISQTDQELENQINDLEGQLPLSGSEEKMKKIQNIKQFISDNRNKLNLSKLDRTLAGRAQQLLSQTVGFRSWFVSPVRKEEILEEAKFLESLRDSTKDARTKLKEEQTKKANRKLEAIIDSFYFSDLDKNSLFNPNQENEFITSHEAKSYLVLIADLIQERDKDVYVKMIHFILNNKNHLDKKVLQSFTVQLNNRILKIECLMNNKSQLEKEYPSLFLTYNKNEDFLTSSKLKAKVTYLKDLRDLILVEIERPFPQLPLPS